MAPSVARSPVVVASQKGALPVSKNKRKLTGRYDPTRRVRPAPPVSVKPHPHDAAPAGGDEAATDADKASHAAPTAESRFEKAIDARKQPVANQKRWGKRKGGDK